MVYREMSRDLGVGQQQHGAMGAGHSCPEHTHRHMYDTNRHVLAVRRIVCKMCSSRKGGVGGRSMQTRRAGRM